VLEKKVASPGRENEAGDGDVAFFFTSSSSSNPRLVRIIMKQRRRGAEERVEIDMDDSRHNAALSGRA